MSERGVSQLLSVDLDRAERISATGEGRTDHLPFLEKIY